VASYGTQLGWITDVLLDAAEAGGTPTSERATAALHMLRKAAREIEELKSIKYHRDRCT
jgi:hypothetical protein